MLPQGARRRRGPAKGLVVALKSRRVATSLGALGALAAGIAGNAVGASATTGVAWAALAAVALSLMLHGTGLRVLGLLLALLGVGGIAASITEQPWIIGGFIPVIGSAVLMILYSPRWRSSRPTQTTQRSLWEDLDNG